MVTTRPSAPCCAPILPPYEGWPASAAMHYPSTPQRWCRRGRDSLWCLQLLGLQLGPRATTGPTHLRWPACSLVATGGSLVSAGAGPCIRWAEVPARARRRHRVRLALLSAKSAPTPMCDALSPAPRGRHLLMDPWADTLRGPPDASRSPIGLVVRPRLRGATQRGGLAFPAGLPGCARHDVDRVLADGHADDSRASVANGEPVAEHVDDRRR